MVKVRQQQHAVPVFLACSWCVCVCLVWLPIDKLQIAREAGLNDDDDDVDGEMRCWYKSQPKKPPICKHTESNNECLSTLNDVGGALKRQQSQMAGKRERCCGDG